jgi:hypothetical protein
MSNWPPFCKPLLTGDYNVVPNDFDIYPTKSWAKDACAACPTGSLPAAARTGMDGCHKDAPPQDADV